MNPLFILWIIGAFFIVALEVRAYLRRKRLSTRDPRQRVIIAKRLAIRVVALAAFPAVDSVLHETSHGLGALLEGFPPSSIEWWPFTGVPATLVHGKPGVIFYAAPYLFGTLAFTGTFIWLTARESTRHALDNVFVSFGLLIPFVDTFIGVAICGIRKTDLAVVRYLASRGGLSFLLPLPVLFVAVVVLQTFALSRLPRSTWTSLGIGNET